MKRILLQGLIASCLCLPVIGKAADRDEEADRPYAEAVKRFHDSPGQKAERAAEKAAAEKLVAAQAKWREEASAKQAKWREEELAKQAAAVAEGKNISLGNEPWVWEVRRFMHDADQSSK